MICDSCLVNGICIIACNKIKNITIDNLESSEKLIQRVVNSTLELRLIKDNITVYYKNGVITWFKNGLRHREDGPAIYYGNVSKHWYRNGLRHREDGPAVDYYDGTKRWYKNGILFKGN